MSGALVYQQSPGQNSAWERVDVRAYEAQMTMVLGAWDISTTPLEDRCGANTVGSTLPNSVLHLSSAAGQQQ
jgi:hypothetical protein